MKVELKNVKYAAFASQETSCFDAKVYIDGKCEGDVSNEGRGGAHRYHPYTLEAKLEEWAKTLPPVDLMGDGKMVPQSAEGAINGLLEDWLSARDYKRAIAKNVLFEMKDGKCYRVNAGSKPMPDAIASVASRPGVVRVLNALPLEEGLAHYKRLTAPAQA